MAPWNRIRLMLAALGLTVLLAGPSAADEVTFENADATAECGVLVDGSIGGSDVNDQSYTGPPGSPLGLGNIGSGSRNEIIGFQAGRPVALVEDVGWTTNDDDEAAVAFGDELQVPVCVWFVLGMTSIQFNRAVAALIGMAAIWKAERAGLALGEIELVAGASGSSGSSLHDIRCTSDPCHEAERLHSDVGFRDGMVNVYYVDRVDYGDGMSSGNGMWCGENTIVMGSETGPSLLTHEFGHACALGHIDGMPDYDETNVMHSASDSRRYLTEGQTFRMNLEPSSVINESLNLRPGLPTRVCGDYSTGSSCPALSKRIWADGTFGAE